MRTPKSWRDEFPELLSLELIAEIQHDAREGMVPVRVCELIGSIYYYGHFRAETPNERELESLLRELGYFFESEDQLMNKLHPNLFTT